MSDDKTRATATLTASVTIMLDQPWGPEAILSQVYATAERQAYDRIRFVNEELAKHGVSIASPSGVILMITKEKRP